MNSNNVQSRIAATDLSAFTLVMLDATGKAAVAGATDRWIGSVLQDAKAGKAVDLALRNGYPCHDLITGNATAIVPGDEVEQLAAGKIGKFAAGTKVGVAIQGSVEAGSQIEVMVY
jgi:hypothetical protein